MVYFSLSVLYLQNLYLFGSSDFFFFFGLFSLSFVASSFLSFEFTFCYLSSHPWDIVLLHLEYSKLFFHFFPHAHDLLSPRCLIFFFSFFSLDR